MYNTCIALDVEQASGYSLDECLDGSVVWKWWSSDQVRPG